MIIAAPEFFAAKIGGGEVELLEIGAHRAVEHDDVIGQCVEIATVGKRTSHSGLSLCLLTLKIRPCII